MRIVLLLSVLAALHCQSASANISKECMEIVKKDIPPKEMQKSVEEFIQNDSFPFTYP